jgi:hypothetical protein
MKIGIFSNGFANLHITSVCENSDAAISDRINRVVFTESERYPQNETGPTRVELLDRRPSTGAMARLTGIESIAFSANLSATLRFPVERAPRLVQNRWGE